MNALDMAAGRPLEPQREVGQGQQEGTASGAATPDLPAIPAIDLDRDGFLRTLICDLGHVLEDVVGLEQAEGLVAVVAQRMGAELLTAYRAELDLGSVTPAQVGALLVDLKTRIQGRFSLLRADQGHLALCASTCPFGDQVIGRPVLCMMTSNVFGAIVAELLGYARVELRETIARGDAGCQIHVGLDPLPVDEPLGEHEREYFGDTGR